MIGSPMAEGDFVRNYFRVTDARTGDRLVDKTYSGIENSAHYGADEQMVERVAAHMLRGAPLPVSVVDALEAGLTAIKIDEARRSRTVYFGRGQTILIERERIKRQTIANRRSLHRRQAA